MLISLSFSCPVQDPALDRVEDIHHQDDEQGHEDYAGQDTRVSVKS
jgi:hypothetical protein